MLVAERPSQSQKDRYQAWHDSLPTVTYPPEFCAQLEAEAREAMEQYRRGELVPMTAAEFAAECGINLDELDDLDEEDY